MENLVYITDNNLYTYYEKKSGSHTNRRCIDGSITGCGKCVGYCQYREHPGFLTKIQREEHDCINKKCSYYIPKPQRDKPEKRADITSELLRLAKQYTAKIEDLRIIRANYRDEAWIVEYVTVFGSYDFSDVEQKLQEEYHVTVIMQKLPWSFERCVELVCDRG